ARAATGRARIRGIDWSSASACGARGRRGRPAGRAAGWPGVRAPWRPLLCGSAMLRQSEGSDASRHAARWIHPAGGRRIERAMRPGSSRETPLLTARWRDLVVVNYVVDPAIVAALAPRGTEPDLHEGLTFLSLVGFLFEDARLAGRVPLWPCATFEEVNLRFYVRRLTPEGPRRGVAFVREIVPCRTIAWGARLLYHEPYVVRRTAHRAEGGRFSYRFESGGTWLEIAARTSGSPQPLHPGSEEEFILDHEWGWS